MKYISPKSRHQEIEEYKKSACREIANTTKRQRPHYIFKGFPNVFNEDFRPYTKNLISEDICGEADPREM